MCTSRQPVTITCHSKKLLIPNCGPAIRKKKKKNLNSSLCFLAFVVLYMHGSRENYTLLIIIIIVVVVVIVTTIKKNKEDCWALVVLKAP
jgi:chromate transport protein ChrA